MSLFDQFAELLRSIVGDAVREALHVNPATNRRLLTVDQAAEYLALSERQIWTMIERHELPVVASGRRKMVDLQDLDEWIRRNKVTS